jgi:hypothetical protein
MTLADSIKISSGGPLCPEKYVIRIHGNVLRQSNGAPWVFDTYKDAEDKARQIMGESHDE